VKGISQFAFLNCTNLSTVRVKDLNTSLTYGGFDNCTKLTKIEVPSVSLSKYQKARIWEAYASIIIGF